MFLEALETRSLLATITNGVGPGGLELPSTNVAIWLDGSDPAGTGTPPANGAAIATWVDKSGFMRDATVTTAPQIPTYVSADAAVNNRGAVTFQTAGGADLLGTTFDFDALGANYTVLAVSRYNGPSHQRVITSSTRNWLLGHHNPATEGWYYEGGPFSRGPDDQNPRIYTALIGPDADGVAGGAPVTDFWSNGTRIDNDSTALSATVYKPGRLQLGGHATFGQNSDANISELVIFNRVLNEAEVYAVQNALSAKYSLNIGAQDIYAGDDPGNGDFDFNLIGIGRVNAANQMLSAGQAGFGIEATTINDDGDFVGGAHNVLTNTFLTTGLPAGVQRRWARMWGVGEADTDNDLSVTMAFDYSDAGLTIGSANSFKLLFSTNGVTFTDVGATAIVSGDLIRFNLTPAQLNTGIYTLGDATGPVITTSASNQTYTIATPAVAIDPALTVVSPGNPTITGATVAVAGFVAGNADVLALPAPVGPITGSFNATTGVLTLSGSATAAQYETALRSVTFAKATYQATSFRTITYTVTDGASVSGSNTRGIVINATAASNPIVWDGTGDGINWTDNSNWVGDLAPDGNDIAVFSNLDPGIVNVPTNVTVGGISFTSTGTYTINSAGGNLALSVGTVTQSGTTSNTINVGLAISSPATAMTVDVVGGTTLTVNGALSGTGNLNKNNAGILLVAGSNTYTGNTNVNGGTLRISGSSVVPSAPSGAAGVYTFDSVAGTTVNNAGTLGAAENGILVAGATVVGGGQIGNAMSTTATGGSRMEIGTSPGISIAGGNWTAAAWFNGIYPTTDWRTLFRGGGNDHQIIIENGSNRLGVYDNAGGGAFRDSGFLLPTSVTGWHHIAAVGSGTTTTLFVDGVQVGVSDRKSVTDIFSVGAYQGGSQRFAQLIDEVYVYQSALTPAQVTQLYQNGAGIPIVTSNNSIPDASVVTVAAGATLDLAGIPETIGGLAGAGTVTSGLAGAATLTVGGGNTSGSFSGVIQNGAGVVGLSKIGTGTQTLSGANTYGGTTTVQNGTLLIAGAANRLPVGTSLTLGAGATGAILDLNGQSQALAGLATSGAGVNRVVNSGAGTPDLTLNFASGTQTFGGILGNTAQNGFNLVKSGAGTQVLTGANTYTGTTTINGGVLQIGADANLGTAPGAFTANSITIANNATLRTTATFALSANRGITLGAGGATWDVSAGGLTYGGRFTGGTGLTKTGGGDMILTNGAAGSAPGTININAGRLFFSSQNAIGTGTINVANGATLDYQTGGALSLANLVNLASGANIASRTSVLTVPNATLPTAGLLVINRDDQNTNTVILPQNIALTGPLTIQVGGGGGNGGVGRLDGVISGAQGLTKIENGVLHLNAVNTFTGDVNIAQGTVRVSQNNALGTVAGATNVLPGAQLQFDGNVNYTTTESVRMAGFGNSGTIGNFSGNNTFAGNVQILTPGISKGTFSGGDIGEGLDFDGNFLYAVNARGPGVGLIRNANFTDQAGQPNVVITAQNEILNWQTPNFGATTNDDNLEVLMQSIRWSGNPATVNVALNNLTVGQTYKLQLMFYEPGNLGRGFDIYVDGMQIMNDFVSGNSPANNGTVVTYEFAALNTSSTVVLNGAATPYGDKNPILDAISLEQNTGFTGAAGVGLIRSDAGNLTLSGVVSGTLDKVNKIGAGSVTLTGANTYGGATLVNQGTLIVGNPSALGTTAAGTMVLPGGTLGLTGGVTLATEPIMASGTGTAGQPGAIVNVAGTNTLASPVTAVGAELRIGSVAGTMTVSGNINMTTASLSFDGAGNVVVSGVISQGSAVPLNGVIGELEIWLDATDPNADGSAVANGAVVSNWQDKSGQNHDFDSMLGDPNYVTTSTHGLPAINFDGDDALRTNLTTNNPRNFIDGNGEFTLISVARYSGADRERVISAVSGHNWLFGFHGNSTNRGGHYDGWGSLDAAPVGNTTDTNWHLHANQMNVYGDNTNPAGDWWRDGVLLTNDGRGTGDFVPNNVPDGLSLGAWNGLGESSTAEVSELLMFNRVLSDGELQLVQTYLNGKYSLGIPVPITTIPVVAKLGTGTVTLTAANTYNTATIVNAGTLVAGNAAALGTPGVGTTVNSGGSLGLTGGITLAGESISLIGLGAAGMGGALTNISGNNTVNAPTTVAASDGAQVFSIGSVAGTLTLNVPINMKFARLYTDGAGNIVFNGALSSVLPANPSLATLNAYPSGNYTLTAAGQTFSANVNNDGTNSWLLIGRGRDGWEFDTDGQGTTASVNSNLGVVAGFAPAAYSDAIVNDLLLQAGLNNTNTELRIRRATDATGVGAYQESRWTGFATPNFTFDFDAGSGIPVTSQVFASALNGAAGPAATNTRDTIPPFGNDATRHFTWPWGGHNNRQGFSYGSTIGGVDNNSPTSFLWEFSTENHAIPYAEIYIRGNSQVIQDNSVIKNGAGTVTFNTANTYAGTTTVQGGMLVVANSAALGSGPAGTTLSLTGSLGLQGSLNIATEPLTINGTNGNTLDRIVNLSGTNTYGGPITFQTLSTTPATTVAAFTGGDIGDGLDLSGNFLYAVNVRGPATGMVQDVSFTSSEGGGTPGLTYSAPNEILNYTNPQYGSTINDNNLEIVMQSIRWNGGPVSFDLTGMTPGNAYKVQLLFSDAYPAPNRFFNVTMEGTTFLTNFTSGSLTSNQVVTRTYTAADGTLNISLNPGTGPDTNPIISGITVENLGPAPAADLNIRSDAGALTITSGLALNGSVLTLRGAGNIVLPGNISQSGASSLVKNDAGTTTLSGANTYSGTTTINGGVLQLQGGNAILNTGGAVSAALGATLQLLTSETISSFNGAGEIGPGTNDSTLALGNNTLTATGSVAIANVTAGTGASIVAGTSITDTDDDNNITATSIVLQAGTGIGTAANPIETTVSSLEASGGTGGVFIGNTGNLTLGGVSALVGVSATGGDIVLSTAGSMTITENVTATGAGVDVTISTIDAAAVGQNLSLSAGVTVSSAAATVTLSSGDDAAVSGNITSGLTTTINVDAGNADAGTGGALTITGIITTPVVGSGGGAFLNGQTDNDTFTFAPQTTTEFRVNGNLPVNVATGDSLVLNTASTTGASLALPGTIAPYTGPGSGAWSFTSAHRPVLFTSIENNAIAGPYHLTYNNGITPVTNLVVMRDPTQAILQLRDGSNAGPVVFQGTISNVLSLTVLGSAGNDTVTVDDINTLPNFSSTVPGVTDNAAIPGTAEFLFDGLGGTDTLTFAISGANASQLYAIGNGTGAAGLQGEIDSTSAALQFLTYFQNVELTTRTGAGATPGGLTIIGDSGANAVTIAANMASTRAIIPGYTPFEFTGNNYNSISVNTLAGTDTIDLASFGSGQTNNPTINLNGGNDDDVLRLRSTSGNTGVVTVIGGLGSDQFLLYDNAPTVDGIVGPVIIDGTDGSLAGNNDTLVIDDRADATGDSVIIGPVNAAISADYRIEGITSAVGNDVIFRNIDELTYTATAGNDVIDTQLVNTTPQHDLSIVTVNGWVGGDQFLLFTSDQAGGTSPTPTGVASGVAIVNLNGDAPGNPNGVDGNDIFGQTPPGLTGTGSGNVGLFVPDTVRGLRPSTSTAININGGQPTGPAMPTGDTVGDVINVDVSGLPGASALILPTVSGVVASTGLQPLSYAQIEDFNLVVSNQLVNVQMGDTFVRGTTGQDLIQFMRNPVAGNPASTRVRVNTLVVDFTLTGKTLTFAGDSNDYITQSNVTNPAEVYGEGGDDYISGGIGNDFLVGGLGNDQINASGGDNVVWGDSAPTIPTDPTPQDTAVGGNDVLSGLGGNDVFYGGGGNDQVSAGGGNDYAYGGQGDDVLDGNNGDDRLYGGLGDDIMNGHDGHDLLSGGGGNDFLNGSTGNDVLIGGTGEDTLNGSNGDDVLVSGSVANEASIWSSVASTATFGAPTYSNPTDNDAALLSLLTQWSLTGNRTSLGAITHDGQDDDLLGSTGDDDFCYETLDLLDEFPATNPADFNAFGMGTDERFGPTA